MSEKKFKLSKWCGQNDISCVLDEQGVMLQKEVVDKLNEQQSIINKEEIKIHRLIRLIIEMEKVIYTESWDRINEIREHSDEYHEELAKRIDVIMNERTEI